MFTFSIISFFLFRRGAAEIILQQREFRSSFVFRQDNEFLNGDYRLVLKTMLIHVVDNNVGKIDTTSNLFFIDFLNLTKSFQFCLKIFKF